MKGIKLTIFFLMFLPLFSAAQSTVSLDLFPVGLHPIDRSRYLLFENRIDYNGNAVVEPGAILTFEFFTNETRRSIQVQQGFYSDAGAQAAGWTQLAWRAKLIHSYKNKISIAFGPALTYRKSWYSLEGYAENPEKKYKVNGDLEFRWACPVQLQYNYYTGKRSELNVSVFYHYERNSFFPSLGFKYWMSTKVYKNCDCDDGFKRKKLRDWF